MAQRLDLPLDSDIDDDSDDENVKSAARAMSKSLQRSLTRAMSKIAGNLDVDTDSAEFKEIAKSIASVWTGKSIGVKGFGKAVEEELKKQAEKGSDLRKLQADEMKVMQVRLKVLDEYTQKFKISADKRLGLEDQAIRLAEREIILKQNKIKVEEAYDRVSEKLFGGTGALSRIGASLAQQAKPGVTSAISGGLAKMGFEGGLEKLSTTFAKMAPVWIALGAAVAFIVDRFQKLLGFQLEYNKLIVQSTGFTGSWLGTMQGGIDRAAHSLLGLVGSDGLPELKKKGVEAAGALSAVFGNWTGVLGKNIELTIGLSERLGVGFGEAAATVKAMSKVIGFSGDAMIRFTGNLKAASEVAGVSFNQVMSDVAQNAGVLALYTDRSEKSIERAVIRARQLGSTLESQARTAAQFATFEGAATQAFQIQLLTGQRISALSLFTKAQYGDALGIQSQLLKVLGPVLTGPGSAAAKQAAAGILGVSYEEALGLLRGQQTEAEVGGALNKMGLAGPEYEAAYKQMRVAQEDISKSSLEARAKQVREGRKDIRSVAGALGLGELRTPTDQILALLKGSVDRILEEITNVIVPAMIWVGDLAQKIMEEGILSLWFGGGKQTTFEERQGLAPEGLWTPYDESIASIGGTQGTSFDKFTQFQKLQEDQIRALNEIAQNTKDAANKEMVVEMDAAKTGRAINKATTQRSIGAH